MVGNVNAKGTEAKITNSETMETTLRVEDWMTSDETWNLSDSTIEDIEPGLELKNWMVNNEIWNISSKEKEPGLKLKSRIIHEKARNYLRQH